MSTTRVHLHYFLCSPQKQQHVFKNTKIQKYTNTRNTKSSLKNTSGDHWCTCPFSPAPFSLCSSQTNILLRAPHIQAEKNPLSYGVGKIYVLKGTQNLVWLFPKKYNPILEWILSAQEFSSWASPIFSKRVSYIFLHKFNPKSGAAVMFDYTITICTLYSWPFNKKQKITN